MADTPGAVPDREDPALVRPYVRATGGVAAQERGPGEEETWPESASMPPEPAPADDDTAVQPVVAAAAPRAYALGLGSRMSILCGGIVLALAVVGFVLLDSEPDEPRPATAVPALIPAMPADPAAVAPPRPSASAGPTPSRSASSPSATPTPTPSAPSRSAAPPSSPAASEPTLAPPPQADRTGAITSAGGRCLALGGLFGTDGSPVQVFGCMDVNAQEFTLAADGTLRVSGKCARATDDASIRVAGCDEAAAGQWRGGPDGTLVNSANGRCLTDPGQAGATARVAACGGADQRWTLP